MSGEMLFSWILWLLFVGGVTCAMLWLMRQAKLQSLRSQSEASTQIEVPTQTDETSLAILQQRYEADEIDQTQFEAIKNHLRSLDTSSQTKGIL